MSLEEIRKSIDKEATARSGSIEREGAAEAAAILKAARASAAEILRIAKSEAEKEAARVRHEQLSGVQMEVSSLVIAAKEQVLEHHMDGLTRNIATQLGGRSLNKIIAGAAKQFLKFSSNGKMVIRTGKKNSALVKKLGYEPVHGAEGELLVESRDGTISIDASPSGLAKMHSAEARALLAARLWKVKG